MIKVSQIIISRVYTRIIKDIVQNTPRELDYSLSRWLHIISSTACLLAHYFTRRYRFDFPYSLFSFFSAPARHINKIFISTHGFSRFIFSFSIPSFMKCAINVILNFVRATSVRQLSLHTKSLYFILS